jgi:pantoate--beta-alanine ligase
VRPDRAYFGRKDYQQLKVIQRMVADLNVPVEIIPVTTVREPDGLAMSSRNTYLNPQERQCALVLNRALKYAQKQVEQGVSSGEELHRRIIEFINHEPLAEIDYAAVVDPETLKPVTDIQDQTLVALAVRIGKTRLIDNAIISR